jgi:MYXO-CTERM domain-containing protein
MSVDPGGLPLTYQWKEQSGTPVTLAGANAAQATFTAPAVAQQTKLTFALQVSDGKGTATDTVDVLVVPGDVMPGGDAGADAGDTLTVSSGAGCDCNTSGAGSSTGAAASLLALAGLVARRRRVTKR